ncbi:MAG: SPFH domain-containing protein [Desulfovibrio sp.]|mgnify:FL=1|jgi:regulator of protease activity HflC (stomatin/prohibitin superfamily)
MDLLTPPLLPLLVFGSVITLVIIILCIARGVYIVRQQTACIVERFGRFRRVLFPGLHFVIPFIDRVSRPINLRIVQLDIKVDTKTEDNVFVKVPVAVQYQVNPEKVREACYKLEEPEEQIESYVFDIVRAEVPRKTLDDLFLSKDDISEAVQASLQKVMDDYGFIIRRSLITDITPDARVAEAMNSINAARRNREAAEHEAEAAKIKLVAAAAAEAESKKLQGEGTANQRKAIARGIAESVQLLRECGVSEREANAILLATQYFDMQQSLGQNSNATTIFTPLSASGAGNTLNDIMGALAAFDNGKKSGNGPQE